MVPIMQLVLRALHMMLLVCEKDMTHNTMSLAHLSEQGNHPPPFGAEEPSGQCLNGRSALLGGIP